MRRIDLTVGPEVPKPSILSGGIERIIDMLVRSRIEREHKVCLVGGSAALLLAEVEGTR